MQTAEIFFVAINGASFVEKLLKRFDQFRAFPVSAADQFGAQPAMAVDQETARQGDGLPLPHGSCLAVKQNGEADRCRAQEAGDDAWLLGDTTPTRD